ncbi:Hypothetical predicted protein [Olea europaea subsp. europaea]|uniref:Transmembrane protein n=1 Tax=Olea europaea subsp. europaea TaxID=158383 RepID=A0A8S0S0J7_OLEEU|nr:Hypothetical predicted protein [Olea europaea subsp. europaea]
MKIIGQNLPAIAPFLILVLGFASTSTNAMKLQFQSSVEEQKGEVNYKHVFISGTSTPTEPPHDRSPRSGPGGPPHGNVILQRTRLDFQSQSSRKEEEKGEVKYKHVFSSGPSTPTEPPHDRSPRSGPGGPPHANGILRRKGLDVQSQSSKEEKEKGEVNYMHVFVSGPSTPTEPPHSGCGPPPLPSSRVGVLNMQPKKIPPPSRPARNHNAKPPNPS